jgi:hypothetical protein
VSFKFFVVEELWVERFGLYKSFGPVDMGLWVGVGVCGGILWGFCGEFGCSFPGLISRKFMGEDFV